MTNSISISLLCGTLLSTILCDQAIGQTVAEPARDRDTAPRLSQASGQPPGQAPDLPGADTAPALPTDRQVPMPDTNGSRGEIWLGVPSPITQSRPIERGGPEPLGTTLGAQTILPGQRRRANSDLSEEQRDQIARLHESMREALEAARSAELADWNAPCEGGPLGLDLAYEVLPRFPLPPSRDPIDVIMPNDRAYVTNNPQARYCNTEGCAEDALTLQVRLYPSLSMRRVPFDELARTRRAEGLGTPGSMVGRLLVDSGQVGGPDKAWQDYRRVEESERQRYEDRMEELLRARILLKLTDPRSTVSYHEIPLEAQLDRWLPQGRTQAELRVDVGLACERREFNIDVDDVFIAAIGDSYASGEGAPVARLEPKLRTAVQKSAMVAAG